MEEPMWMVPASEVATLRSRELLKMMLALGHSGTWLQEWPCDGGPPRFRSQRREEENVALGVYA